MTLDDLMTALHVACAAGRGSWPVVVAGHGALSAVTRGHSEAGGGVVVLYVSDAPSSTTGAGERPSEDEPALPFDGVTA